MNLLCKRSDIIRMFLILPLCLRLSLERHYFRYYYIYKLMSTNIIFGIFTKIIDLYQINYLPFEVILNVIYHTPVLVNLFDPFDQLITRPHVKNKQKISYFYENLHYYLSIFFMLFFLQL